VALRPGRATALTGAGALARRLRRRRGRGESASATELVEERTRLARELHDGLAQELGFVVMQARSRTDDATRTTLDPIATAAERALDETRRIIAALSRPLDEPLDVSIAHAAEEVAHRAGVRVRFDLEANVRAEPATQEAVLQLVREAVSSAARDDGAHTVSVALSATDVIRVRISNDGASRAADGLRVARMRECANRVGGELHIRSAPERGTELELIVPHSS